MRVVKGSFTPPKYPDIRSVSSKIKMGGFSMNDYIDIGQEDSTLYAYMYM